MRCLNSSSHSIPLSGNLHFDAAAKGLAAGDVIIGVDDIRVENISDACTLRDEHKAGDTMKLTFYRQGITHEINIQLMEETNQQSNYDF